MPKKPDKSNYNPDGEAFWFDCTIITRPNGYPVYTHKSGSLFAWSPLEALDQIHNRAEQQWNAVIYRINISDIDANGEIVAQTINTDEDPQLLLPRRMRPSQPPIKSPNLYQGGYTFHEHQIGKRFTKNFPRLKV